MFASQVRVATLAIGASLAVAGCATDYGYGPAYSYYGYPGGPASGQAGYAVSYNDPTYGGWYGDYYYPGNSYYVYNRSGHRQRWNDDQRRYWHSRHQHRDRDGDRH